MGGMALLPQELCGPEEQTGTHLPSNDIGPLVAHDRKISPGLDPILVRAPDNGLGSRSYDEFFLKFR